MISRRKAYTFPGEFEHISSRVRRGELGDFALIDRWEDALAKYIGLPHAAVVNSGRRGLTLTLRHLGVAAGDELIVPAFTFGELLSPIRQLGIKPVPADIDRQTLGVTAQSVEARITPRTKAILGLHAFGVPFDIAPVLEVGRQHGLPIIEDCAHSLGATVERCQTGSFGTASFCSFEAIKPVNTFGGGVVLSTDKSLIHSIHAETASDLQNLELLPKKVRSVQLEQFLFSHGLAFPLLYLLATPMLKRLGRWFYDRSQHSISFRSGYTPLQAELGLKKLLTLDDRIVERQQMGQLLRSLLKPEIDVQQARAGCQSSWYYFVVTLPTAAAKVRKKLLMRGIDAGIEDELTDNCARLLEYEDCENLNDIFPRLMNLPLYDGVTEPVIRKVAAAVNDCV